MRTKRILSAIALAIATICTQSFAQTIYYQTETTYDLGNGVTYRADIRHGGHVYLYNANNIYTYADITYADGSALPVEIADADVPSYSMTAASDRDIQARVNGALTTAQKQIVGDRRLPMSVIVSAQTGKVIEVFFGFSKNSPYKKLPPSVFRQIEQRFLSRPQIDGFALTSVGRQLNYVMFSWAHKFE